MDPGRKHNDEHEPQPEQLYCNRLGVHRSLRYLRNVSYWHKSIYCKACSNKPKCEEKEY